MSHAGIYSGRVSKLPDISDALKAKIEAADRSAETHRALLAEAPAMQMIECGGSPSAVALPSTFSAIAWNLERCLFPEETVRHIGRVDPDVALLSEMDSGMARSGQRNTTAELAEALDMAYAFGVEFHEPDLGSDIERELCHDDFNLHGWHGNAILSKVPPKDALMVRLDDDGHCFLSEFALPYARRFGGRMALLLILPTDAGDICVVSTHFESDRGCAWRDRQMTDLLDVIDVFAPDLPVLIGGDLNTGNNIPGADWRAETLFDRARERGFSWDANESGPTTRPSLLTPDPPCQMKLDWFCSRAMKGTEAAIVSSLDEDGRPLSDHDMIKARFSL